MTKKIYLAKQLFTGDSCLLNHAVVVEDDQIVEILPNENIIANVTAGDKVKNAHGISIYFPLKGPPEDVLHIYRKLDFTVTYPNWLKLITAFHTSPTLQR